LNYPVQFVEWSENAGNTAFEDEDLRIVWHPLKHSRFCLGFRLEERDRPGKFDPLKARAEKIPEGPLWGLLQKGQPVSSADGRQIHPEKVLGPPRRGRRMAYVVDTRPTPNIYHLAHEVDLAFLEGMFLQEHSHHATEKGHMTVRDGARIGRRAGAGQVVLVHISPRYGEDDLSRLDEEAVSQFPMARMGRDQDVFFIKPPD
jgi:ribonuclease Z